MKKRHLFIIISLCFVIIASIGLTINVGGLFFNNIADELQVMKGSVGLTVTICNLSYAVGGLIAPFVLDRFSVRKVIVMSAAVLIVFTGLLGTCSSLPAMYLCNAIRGIFGSFTSFYFLTAVINHWFLQHTGLITSIVFSFSSIGSACFSPVISNIIENYGWRTAYFATAVFILCLYIPAVIIIPSLRPQDSGYMPYGHAKTVPVSEGGSPDDTETSDKAGSVVRKKDFILLFIFVFVSCSTVPMAQYLPGMAQSRGLSAAIGASMISLCFITSTFGKILMGYLADRKGVRVSVILFTAITTASVLILCLSKGMLSMYIGAGLFGASYTFSSIAIVLMTKSMFGLENYAKTYPKTKLAGSVAHALSVSYLGYICDYTGGYNGILYMVLALLLIAVIFEVMIFRPGRYSENDV